MISLSIVFTFSLSLSVVLSAHPMSLSCFHNNASLAWYLSLRNPPVCLQQSLGEECEASLGNNKAYLFLCVTSMSASDYFLHT